MPIQTVLCVAEKPSVARGIVQLLARPPSRYSTVRPSARPHAVLCADTGGR